MQSGHELIAKKHRIKREESKGGVQRKIEKQWKEKNREKEEQRKARIRIRPGIE